MFYIRTIGDPVLRKECDPVTEDTFFLSTVWSIFDQMVDIMRRTPGAVGLAANQIGISRQFFVYDHKNKLDIMINPEIVEKSDKIVTQPEQCLSLPTGTPILVPRHDWIIVRGLDYYGEEKMFRAKGFVARLFQHEMDHLHGKLISDYDK